MGGNHGRFQVATALAGSATVWSCRAIPPDGLGGGSPAHFDGSAVAHRDTEGLVRPQVWRGRP